MFNATLMGRLTKDPEQKTTTTGAAYASFRIAINNGKDRSGAEKPTTFVECSVFGKTGEFVTSYARKGARVVISAGMEIGTYQNKNTGETMLSVSAMVDTVELIDWPDKDQAPAVAPQQAYQQPPQYGAPPAQQYGAPPQAAVPPVYPPQQVQYAAPPAQGYQQQQLQPQYTAPPVAQQYGAPPVQQQYAAAPQQASVQQQAPAATPWGNSPI